MSEEEKKAIEYLKSRLYGNEGCKFIDVAQSDLRIFLNLVENLQKDIENWEKYCDEQENDITLKNNKICDLEFKIEKQSKEIEELKKDKLELINKNHVVHLKDVEKELREMRKEIDTKNAEIECLNVIHESYKEMVEENNFISKDKVKEKIEELEKERKRKDEEDIINPFYDQIDITHIIEVLQELLEKE